MADLAISFNDELIIAGPGIYCMAGEANINLAGFTKGGNCSAWNHGAVQKMVLWISSLEPCGMRVARRAGGPLVVWHTRSIVEVIRRRRVAYLTNAVIRPRIAVAQAVCPCS